MAHPVTVLFDGYYVDLAGLARLVAGDVARAGDPEVGLLEKLALETARLVVNELCFLLPALRQVVPDGQLVAQREAQRLVPLLDSMRALERLPPRGEAVRRPLAEFVGLVEELGEQRRTVVHPALIAGLDDATLVALGDRVAPTFAAGTTHSHPTEAPRYAGAWPRPGFTDEMAEVFAVAARARQPAVSPVQV